MHRMIHPAFLDNRKTHGAIQERYLRISFSKRSDIKVISVLYYLLFLFCGKGDGVLFRVSKLNIVIIRQDDGIDGVKEVKTWERAGGGGGGGTENFNAKWDVSEKR